MELSSQVNLTHSGDLVPDIRYYGSVSGGDHYFSQLGRGDAWTSATSEQKLSSLKQATEIIDKFHYKGSPGTSGKQFPRSGQDEVPAAIEKAAYEIARRFLEGYDPENVNGVVVEERFGPVSTKYAYKNAEQPLHVKMGIPSIYAYEFLFPYFVDLPLKLERSS